MLWETSFLVVEGIGVGDPALNRSPRCPSLTVGSMTVAVGFDLAWSLMATWLWFTGDQRLGPYRSIDSGNQQAVIAVA